MLRKYLQSITPPYSRRDSLPILLTLFVLLIIPLTIIFLKEESVDPSRANTLVLPLPMKVFVLMYFPPNPSNNTLLDGVETGWGTDATINGRTIANFWEPKTVEMVNAAIPLINDGSRYHGYKDQGAPAFFSYQVADTKKYYIPIPRGFRLGTNPDGTPNYRPNYRQIMLDHNICNYVDNLGVKEVWMYGYHSKTIVPDESRMSSRHGDISNSFPKESSIPEQYRLPLCTNAYTLYNFTYQPGGGTAISNNIHNRLHQIENMIPFTENRWPPTTTNIPGSTFWGDFSEYVQSTTVHSYRSSCGNTHYTPNWVSASADNYRYNSTTQAEFNCETWNPDQTKTTYIKAACERWGCTELGFYKWYMQNIPGYNNGITYNGQPMKNWWEAMYDFNKFIDNGKSLYGTSILTSVNPTTQPASPTPAITGNLALNKPATSNRISVSGHEPGKAVDGNTSTPDNSWQVYNPLNAGDWWQVDLGTASSVSKVVIYPNTVNYGDMCNAFTISSSTTGSFSGEQRIIVTEQSRLATQTNTYTFTPVSARYIRLTCTVSQNWVQLQELQVHGSVQTGSPTPQFTPTPIFTLTPTPTPTRVPTVAPTSTSSDTTAPNISITSPLNNSVVARKKYTLIQASASDNVGVQRVQFYVNNTLYVTDTTPPYSYNWYVPAAGKAKYTIRATAFDAAGNSRSASINVSSR